MPSRPRRGHDENMITDPYDLRHRLHPEDGILRIGGGMTPDRSRFWPADRYQAGCRGRASTSSRGATDSRPSTALPLERGGPAVARHRRSDKHALLQCARTRHRGGTRHPHGRLCVWGHDLFQGGQLVVECHASTLAGEDIADSPRPILPGSSSGPIPTCPVCQAPVRR